MSRRRPLNWLWALGVPMVLLGACAAFAAVTWPSTAWQETAGLAGLAVLFGGLGLMNLVVSHRVNRETRRRNRLAEAYPEEPWRWRSDWDDMRMEHKSRRWGTTTLHIEMLPGLVGGSFSGTLALPFRELPSDGLRVTLEAVHSYFTGTGTRRRLVRDTLWEGARPASVSSSPQPLEAYFSFEIPAGLPGTRDDDPNDEIHWQLTVSTKVHGRRFRCFFIVPIFAVG